MTKAIRKCVMAASIAIATMMFGMGSVVAQDAGFDNLSQPLPRITAQEQADFDAGLEVFTRDFGPPGFGPPPDDVGGGPLRNTFGPNSCAACHTDAFNPDTGENDGSKDGAGHNAFRATQVTAHNPDGSCDHMGDRGGPGFQLNVTALLGMGIVPRPQDNPGPYQDFNGEYIPTVAANPAAVLGPADDRTTNDLFGLGLLDAMPDWRLALRADPFDWNGDGVSGRVHWVTDHHGEVHVGKFGRKAEVAHLDEFNAEAFQNEQGVTNPEFSDEGVTVIVGGPGLNIQSLNGLDGQDEDDVDGDEMDLLNAYVRFLAQPAQNSGAMPFRKRLRAKALFATIGCASCHTPLMVTGWHSSRALRWKVIRPYSDMLLHDMGPDLAEGCKGDAEPEEWRTEPLWGLRFVSASQPIPFPFPDPLPPRRVALMHDGRADSVDAAIRMHGGEAEGARDAYVGLPKGKRKLLLDFLNTL